MYTINGNEEYFNSIKTPKTFSGGVLVSVNNIILYTLFTVIIFYILFFSVKFLLVGQRYNSFTGQKACAYYNIIYSR